MSTYNTVMSAISNMTKNELKDLAEILDMYTMCQGDDKRLFMFATKSFVKDRFFTTFIDARSNN